MSPAVAPAAALESSEVLHRVNAGGSEVSATDAAQDWEADTASSPSSYFVAGSGDTSSQPAPSTIHPSVPSYVPAGVWTDERWDNSGGDEMQWEFPVPDGQQVEVRLYFYDGYSGTASPGDRVFDVSVEDQLVLDDYDIIDQYGDQTAVMESFTVTSDGTIDVDFGHVTENPQINAIEIVAVGSSPGELGAPAQVDLGSVVVGNSDTETVTLTNLGESGNASHPDIEITGVALQGAHFAEFSEDFSGPVTLAPGDSTSFDVTFSPASAGAKDASIEVTHDGANSPTVVPISADGQSTTTVGFQSGTLSGAPGGQLTSLDFGPDGRLYVSSQGGTVYVLNVTRDGQASYSVDYQKTIDAINDIPNHDDDGTHNTDENNRQVTGLTVGGTASDPIVYVSSSDPTIDVGQDDGDTDTNSGAISRLSLDWDGAGNPDELADGEIDHDVMVLGLPRSEENHATNGIDLSADGDTLYVAQGGHTNKGAPGDNFGHTPEYALSAATLEIDLATIESMSATSLNSHDSAYPDLDYYYALPTVQGGPLPFGGDDGLNQAKLVDGGPVQIWSPGYRNPYDLTVAEDGSVYVSDNGPNGGWGGEPADASGATTEDAADVTNRPNEDDSYTTGDQIHLATEGFYAGHAAPIRANPDDAGLWNESEQQYHDFTSSDTPVPFSMADPRQADYVPPQSEAQGPDADDGHDGSIGGTFQPLGGIVEYRASNFDGAMQGDLLVTEFFGSTSRVQLDSDGDEATDRIDGFLTSSSNMLDVTAQDDDEVFPGTVWTSWGGIAVFEPNDFESGGGPSCTGADDAGLDEDGDGYDNADEIAAGTDPCSAGSVPHDYDGDGTSDATDDDDDNDGSVDAVDPLAVDADNGTTTSLPVELEFQPNSFPDTIEGLGFTGLMANGVDDYEDNYDPDSMVAGGAAHILTVEDVPQGDAHASGSNSQQFGFQVGADTPTDSTFWVNTSVSGFPESSESFQSMGMFVGNGDQDNYLKLTVAHIGSPGIQFALEEGPNNFNAIQEIDDPSVNGNQTDLMYLVDPANDTVTAYYQVEDGPTTEVGSTAIPSSWTDHSDGVGFVAGTISTSNGASSTFDASWHYLRLQAATDGDQPPSLDPIGDQTVEEGATLDVPISASDDGGAPSLSATGLPSFASFTDDGDGTATLSATPASGDAGSYGITVTAEDDVGQTDSETFDLTVEPSTTSQPFHVETDPPTGVGSDAATLNGDLTGLGDNDNATVYFNYWVQGQKESTLTWWTGSPQSNPGPFSTAVSLDPGTPYAYQALAQSDEGEWKTGGVQTFVTDAGTGYDVETGTASNVSTLGADLNGTLALGEKSEATTYVRFWVQGQPETKYWYTGETTTESGSFGLPVVLSPSTTYEWQALAQSGDGQWNLGGVETFTTPTGEFFGVTTDDATDVGVGSATLHGELVNLGDNDNATVYFTYWVQGQEASTLTWWTGPEQGSSGPFQATVGGLDPGTTYEFRAFAQSDEGEWKAGPVQTLTTESGEPYAVETDPATGVGSDAATLNGDLTGLGDNDNATVYFNYWVQGQKESTLTWWTGNPQSNPGPFSATVDLQSETTYEVQAFAQSDAGTWKAGGVQTFTTPSTPVEQESSADVGITPTSDDVDETTFGQGSYQITNTGETNVTAVTFDLSTALLPDLVFDPNGSAGDSTGGGFNLVSEGGTGFTGSTFEQPHNGVDGEDGYDAVIVEFDDFQPGETFTFWVDNDPTSIKGATVGSQEAGPVSGLELARSTATVQYDDDTTQTINLFGNGGAGGSSDHVDDAEAAGPTLGVEGILLDDDVLNPYHSGAFVPGADQNITVSGTPGATVTVVRAEAELALQNTPGGHDLELLEANDVQVVEYQEVTLDSFGQGTAQFTLTNTTDEGNADGGYNYFVAAEGSLDSDLTTIDDVGLSSNVVVLKPGSVEEPSAPTTVASNANGPETTIDGVTYCADCGYSTSNTYGPGGLGDIANTDDDELYVDERYGTDFWWNASVQNGEYDVTLHFAEIYHGVAETDSDAPPAGQAGDRLFDVYIEDTLVLDDYDIYAETGSLAAIDEVFTTTVADGEVNVHFVVQGDPADNAKVSAIKVEPHEDGPQPAGPPQAVVNVTPDGGIDVSTFNGGSFQVENTGEQSIQWARFDLSSTALPDMVFDPNGTAGDATGKVFTHDSGAVSPTGSFEAPHNGVDDAEGYDVLNVSFGDFEAGETFTFSVDNDPTSIKDASGTGAAGSVSGLELTRGTVTVKYADGTTHVNQLFGDGSDGGSQALEHDTPPAAPVIGVDGVALDGGVLDAHHSGAQVTSNEQTITVDGPSGGTVTVMQVEAQLQLDAATGHEIEDYEANDAVDVVYHVVPLNGTGAGSVDVTLSESNPTYFVAATENSPNGPGSNVVVLNVSEPAPVAPANFTVSIDSTNSPVTEGDVLSVTATVENTGGASGTQTVSLDVDGTEQHSTPVTLASGASQSVTLSWGTGDGDAGAHTATVASENDSASAPVTVEEAFEPLLAVNANGAEHTTSEGITYSSDQSGFGPGWSGFSTGDAIAGTDEDPLYQSELYGGESGPVWWNASVNDGDYRVTLHLAELFQTADGNRVFDVYVEDELVLDDYDVHADVGHDVAVDHTFDTEVTDGELNVRFDASVDNAKIGAILVEAPPGTELPEPSFETIAVNAGGSAYGPTSDGVTYAADTGFNALSGGTSSTGDPIANTSDDALYQTERYGDFWYNFSVPDGDYAVTLQFAEIWHCAGCGGEGDSDSGGDGEVGDRLMDVTIEGATVLDDYDLYADVGGLNATQETFEVSVSDGAVNVHFTFTQDNAKVSAITIAESE